MSYKKIIILPALFVLSTIVYIGCCKCKEETSKYYDLTKIFVSISGSGNAIVDTGKVTTVDSIYLFNDIYRECIAKGSNSLSFLGNEAMATSCECIACGENGLKNKIDSIIITSDSVYNNIAANISLNAFFKVRQSDNTFITVDSVKNKMNSASYAFPNEQFVTTTKPGNTRKHLFKLRYKFVNGKDLIASIPRRFYWQ
jgi:hypothetical protein